MTKVAAILWIAIALNFSAAASAAKLDDTALKHEIRELVPTVETLRGLSAKRAVPMGVMTRPQILSELKKRLAKEYSEEEIEAESLVLKRLGLLPRELDYKQAVLKLLTDQVAGFYDPQRRMLYIADWLPLLFQRPAMAHELCHALQDQHFNLKRLNKPQKDNSDRQLAQIALIEGDCTGLMLEFVLLPTGKDLSSMGGSMKQLVDGMVGLGSVGMEDTPRFMRETLTFPYVYGLRLVQQIRKTKPWKAVNHYLAHPPQTTEQVLHFDKLLKNELPAQIKEQPLPALAGYRVIKHETVGEFQLMVWLSEAVARSRAEQAAAGWNGDRLVAYQDRKQKGLPLIVHLSSWDSETDAAEYFTALTAVFNKLTQKSITPSVPDHLERVFMDKEGLRWAVQRKGRRILAVVAVPPSLLESLQMQTWSLWKVSGEKKKASEKRASQADRPNQHP